MIKNLWQKYKQLVTSNCVDPQLEDTELAYWRNQLFLATILFVVPLSVLAIVPGVYMAIIAEFYMLLFADFVVVVSFGLIAFSSSLSLRFKEKLMCVSLYFVTIVLLYYLGSFGPGLLYLLAITVFVTLVLEFKYGVYCLIVNTIICVVFALLIHFDIGNSPVVSEYDLGSWIAVSVNLVFLSAVVIILIPRLFEGLQSAFDKRVKAENELKKSKEELEMSLALLEEKSQELEQFAYTASHDLKEPLRMVQGFMGLLKNRYEADLDSRAQKYIHFAVDGAERMSKLIDDLLEYSRIGRVHSKVKEIDLNEMLDELINEELLCPESAENIIECGELPQIKAVPVSINMLFKNLITNALKYQNEKRKPVIRITAEEDENFWRFSISDNGIGIEKQYYESIFMLFNRLHTTDEFPGSGMGLAICKKIVEQHGGEIWVESELGIGTTFYFTIKKASKYEINTHFAG